MLNIINLLIIIIYIVLTNCVYYILKRDIFTDVNNTGEKFVLLILSSLIGGMIILFVGFVITFIIN